MHTTRVSLQPVALCAAVLLAAPAALATSQTLSTGGGRIRIRLMQERTVIEQYRAPAALFSPEGVVALIVNGIAGSKMLVSRDRGETWTENPTRIDFGTSIRFADGSILGAMSGNAIQDKVRPEQARKPFIAHLRRAQSLDDLLMGSFEDDFAKMTIPDLDGCVGDDGNLFIGFVDHGLVEMPNGDLLITMYGTFRQDRAPIPYFPQPSFQNRAWVCVSKDQGNSWRYLSTIASVDKYPLPALAEGYCEADLIRVDGNRLLAVMRSGGNPGDRPNHYAPLYSSVSRDGGRTWEAPKMVNAFGVWPKLLRMSNGAIVCLSGRPGVFLAFSLDGGETWSEPVVIDPEDGPWRECSSGYGSMGETEPGVLTVLYDTGKLTTRMRRYRVTVARP